MPLEKIINLCQKHGFLNKVILQSTQQVLKIGPVGALLKENLRKEWLHNIVTNRDLTVFLNENTYGTHHAAQIVNYALPFGIAQIQTETESLKDPQVDNFMKRTNFNRYFLPEDFILLKAQVFVDSSEDIQFFHQWQRQRRMWWRKFSASPGRYKISDIRIETDDTQVVDILADYKWGEQLIETITLSKNKLDPSLSFKQGKKVLQPKTIESQICFSTMFLNTLFDAYDEPLFQKVPRPLLYLHRKLAPYKISFALTAPDSATLKELKDLALYLSRQFRDNHINTLFVPSSWKWNLETQWKQYDELGIPYNVLLNPNTLRDGVALLRSRDTTLKEQVHVSELVDYIEKLFKNY